MKLRGFGEVKSFERRYELLGPGRVGAHMGPYGPIYGPIWPLMGPYRSSWTGLGRPGHVRFPTVGRISHVSGPKLGF